MSITSERCGVFRSLRQADCFEMPNPWDPGRARVFAQLGFSALATTSAGYAWSLGRPDNGVSLDGQLVIDLRMNGIVPPASRPSPAR